MNPKVKLLETRILSNNWYTLKKVSYNYQRHDGSWQTQVREAYDRGNGAVVLLYNKLQKTVILIRQFRLPTYINGNATGMLVEACAGLLDADTPEACVKREAEEETGYKVSDVKKVFEAYMSPGSVTEIVHFFVAEYATHMKVNDGGGVHHEQEEIEVLEVSLANALSMIKNGEIKDAKTIMLLQHALLENLLD